jgi:hypothetical protein
MVQVRGRKWASGADVWDRQERQPSLKADCEAAQPRQPRRILVTLERRFLFAPAVIGRLLAVIASQTMS